MSMRIESNYELSQIMYSASRKPEQTTSVFGQSKESVDSVKTAQNRYKAMQIRGQNNKPAPGQLIYHKSEAKEHSYFFGLIKWTSNSEPGYYEYIPTGKERIYQIKKRLGIKDGAFYRYDGRYREDTEEYKESTEQCIPDSKTILRFYEYDVE